jgi:hypothetical protein
VAHHGVKHKTRQGSPYEYNGEGRNGGESHLDEHEGSAPDQTKEKKHAELPEVQNILLGLIWKYGSVGVMGMGVTGSFIRTPFMFLYLMSLLITLYP